MLETDAQSFSLTFVDFNVVLFFNSDLLDRVFSFPREKSNGTWMGVMVRTRYLVLNGQNPSAFSCGRWAFDTDEL